MPLANPRFSIIIPTLQEEKYIVRTLDQFSSDLRKQFDFEVIVSDGGSTDKTCSLAKPRADLFTVHTKPFKQTISMGRNAGAELSKGFILIFINADTLIENTGKFFLRVEEALKDPHIVAATCRVNIYPEEERISDRIFHNFFNNYFWFLNLIGLGMGRGECQIIKRNEFFAVSGYNEGLAAGEDFDLFVRVRRHGKIAYLHSLIVRESPRRFRKFGYAKILMQWFINAVSVLFRGKSISDDWEPIR